MMKMMKRIISLCSNSFLQVVFGRGLVGKRTVHNVFRALGYISPSYPLKIGEWKLSPKFSVKLHELTELKGISPLNG